MVIQIDGQSIGPGHPCYIIAECGVNHCGRIDLALSLVDAAKAAGADAAKFQVWRTSRLLAPGSPQYRTLLPLELSYGQFEAIKRHCDDIGITFLATPDQPEDADFLESLGVPAYKIGSGHVTDLALLRHVGAKGKPVLLSTGMSDLHQVAEAVLAIQESGNRQLVLLHCTSAYSTERGAHFDPAACDLRAIRTLAEFGYPVGYSDHTRAVAAAHAAITLGACVYEAHLRLGNETETPDSRVSLGPESFGYLVESIRWLETALGDGVKRPMDVEKAARQLVEEWRV